MDSRKLNKIIEPYVRIDLAALLVFSLLVLWFSRTLGVLCLLVTFVIQVVHARITRSRRWDLLDAYEEAFTGDPREIGRSFADKSPFLLSMVNMEGKLLWSNAAFRQVFPREEDFYAGVEKERVTGFFNKPHVRLVLPVGQRYFRVTAAVMGGLDRDKMMLYWADVTGYEKVRKFCGLQRPAIAFINVDNFDELLASSPADERSTITAEIDRMIRSWAGELSASVSMTRTNRYIMVLENQQLAQATAKQFSLIHDIHRIETQADFPTSLSIGVGTGARTYAQLQKLANEALDLALGRGGDQVVVKHKGGDIDFYGGALTTVEKRNKGKSRIMGHVFQQLVASSNRVLIMGHVRPDMDSFGAAIGVFHMARQSCSNVHIVLEEPGEAIEVIYEAALATGRFSFVTCERALELLRPGTLLVVVDTHIAALTECPKLLDKVEQLVIIDHHRRSKDAIGQATLFYAEVYASSTSELIAEMLQYSAGGGEAGKFELEALLAGIMVDTKNFSVNTGVRTFEAASWLRGKGADIQTVRSFFKMSLDFYQKKANLIANAEILGGGVAVAYTKDQDDAMQILTSQVADDLLDMKGVQAAFVAGRGKDMTMVSGRSTGRINVQTILEKLGGGGHLAIAGAQLTESPEEAILKVVAVLRELELL